MPCQRNERNAVDGCTYLKGLQKEEITILRKSQVVYLIYGLPFLIFAEGNLFRSLPPGPGDNDPIIQD
jgi:hypothetical protein